MRKTISQGGSLHARTILGLGVRDLTGGFKCFRREVLEGIDLATVRSTGFRVREVPIVFEDRRVGQSKMSKKIFLEALTMVWKIR